MKKIIYLLTLFIIIFITGCTNITKENVKEKFLKSIEQLNSYNIEGTLKINVNEDSYEYNLNISHQKEDNYKVIMDNKSNDYTQIILRNKDAVYVTTPALNKTFKFQSNWPYNNSESYILESLKKDLENDKDYTFDKQENTYTLTSKVTYQNNPKLVKERITIDKDYNLKKVEVLTENDIVLIEFVVKKFDKNPTYKKDYFELDEEEIKTEKDEIARRDEEKCKNTENCDKVSTTLDESLFPLYLPLNTSLSNKEVINKNDGKRVIMTFSGDNPFILVQETITPEEELSIVPTYGEPFMLMDTIGSLTDVSYTWESNGIEYYIVSDVLSQSELLEVAKSINTVSTIYEK